MVYFASVAFQDPPPSPPAPNTGAGALVGAGWVQAQSYAQSAFIEATQFLNQISAASTQIGMIPDVNASLSAVAATINAFSVPLPTDLALNLPALPTDPTLTPVAPIAIGPAPQFTAVPLPLDLPTAPSALTTSVPLAPSLPDVLTPAPPDIVLPDVPSLIGINIPAAPVLNLPSFSATLAAAPTAPANTFSFMENTYTSTLLTDLRARLLEWVDGAQTGIAPVVEQAIWNRGRAREAVASTRKMQESIRTFATRGFSKPPGALAVALQEAVQEAQDNDITLSRDIMIKQADMEQSNRKYAFDTAFKVESDLITYQNNIAQRSFEVARYAQQVAIDIFTADVQRYQADVQAYNVRAQVFKTLIDAELSKLEVYKSELEGQKLIGELNVQQVDIYKARVGAAMALVEIFKAQVEAANLSLQGNKVRIDAFAAQVNAYDSTVRAKAAEYQGYATRVQAEVAKIDLFKGQADAYRSEVEGFRAVVEAVVAEKNIEIEVNQKLPLDVFKARTEIFRTTVDAESARVGAIAKVYEAEVQGESARVGAEVNVFKAESDVAIAEGNLRIEAAKANVQKLIQQVTMLVESVKAGAQVSAQLAAAALSSINLSGQIGDHSSNSSSNSVSYGVSNSASLQAASQIGDMTYRQYSYSTNNTSA